MRVVLQQEPAIAVNKLSWGHLIIARIDTGSAQRQSSKDWVQLTRNTESRGKNAADTYQWSNISTLITGFASTTYPTIVEAVTHMLMRERALPSMRRTAGTRG